MTNWLDNKKQGVILLVLAVLLWAPLPGILPWDTIAAVLLLVLGLYNLFR